MLRHNENYLDEEGLEVTPAKVEKRAHGKEIMITINGKEYGYGVPSFFKGGLDKLVNTFNTILRKYGPGSALKYIKGNAIVSSREGKAVTALSPGGGRILATEAARAAKIHLEGPGESEKGSKIFDDFKAKALSLLKKAKWDDNTNIGDMAAPSEKHEVTIKFVDDSYEDDTWPEASKHMFAYIKINTFEPSETETGESISLLNLNTKGIKFINDIIKKYK